MRKLSSILGNSQMLDGGAMFGNAPSAMWSRWIEPDEHNRIPLSCRALLVEEETSAGKRNILLETGIGAFFDPKYASRFGIVEEEHMLLKNLATRGIQHEDIDAIVLSHLHFDHAGGLLKQWEKGKDLELLFPNATFIVGEEAWERATNPHPRDRASFISRINKLLEESGRLEVVKGETSKTLGEGYRFHISHGHTPGMLLTEVAMPDGGVLFAADLIPGSHWVHVPITMGYDRAPELLINEKEALLNDLVSRNGRLFFTHDFTYAMGDVSQDKSGKFFADNLVANISDLEK